MAERIIPFPFQKKQLQDGEKLPVADRVMEESKTLDKWQITASVPLAFIAPPIAAAMLGYSIVSHEMTRAELEKRREKRTQLRSANDPNVINLNDYRKSVKKAA